MNNVDDFLEHVGIKGMRWGVRKKSGRTKEDRSNVEAVSSAKKGAKIAGVVATAAVLGAGSVFVSRTLKKNGAAKLASKQIAINRVKRLEEHQKIVKGMAEKQVRLIAAANQHLRGNYNDLMTPLPKREFLDPTFWKNLVG